MKTNTECTEVVVVGGGPAGSACAAVLAGAGHQVVVLEKDTFPRYHIGESLIPFCYFPLEKIGMIPRLKASHFPKKYSVQFISQDGRQSQPFYFQEHIDHPCAQTWQVLRSEFDTMMRDNAVEKGADFREGWKVREVIKNDRGGVKGVVAVNPEGVDVQIHSRVVVDASGRDGLAQSRMRWRVPDRNLQRLAVWTYYTGAKRDPGMDEGATTVAYVDGKNWFWYIPLPDNRVSVGVVGPHSYLFDESKNPEEVFVREIQKNTWLADHVSTGTRDKDVHVTSDYSYRSEYCATDGLVLVGDAVAFLDPVFSSGMFFALYGGVLAGESIVEGLNQNRTDGAIFQSYATKFHAAFESMRALVYSFYDADFNFGKLLKKYPHLRADITDLLIGHVDKDFTELFDAMREYMTLPEKLPLGNVQDLSRETAVSGARDS